VSLVAATPSAGYTSGVSSKGSKAVKVQFTSPHHTSSVTVTCIDGSPLSQVDERDR
jgi:hypothetical protein